MVLHAGTVGDIESGLFLESLRQLKCHFHSSFLYKGCFIFRHKVGSSNFCLAHVSLVPEVGGDLEQKSKPTQHSIVALRAVGTK